jgi:hypothetical protein
MSELQSWARALGGEVSGNQVLCPGPGHDAEDRSLSVKLGKNGEPIVHSFAGDDWRTCRDYAREKLGLPDFKPNGDRRTVATFEFRDPATGDVRYRKERVECADGTKSFFFKPAGRNGSEPLLYGGERLADTASDQQVFIVEGEKKVDRLRELGAVAVSGDSGASSKWLPAHADLLRGLPIILWPDSDEPGEKYAARAADCLRNSAASLKIVRPFGSPNGAKGRDVCDWPDNADDLATLAAGAQPYAESEVRGAPKRFELIPFDQIKFDGVEEWLVKGLLPRHGVGAFFGAKSAFKSFAAQDLAMHVACGWNWAGRRVMQAPVVYIAAEGAGGLRKRKAGFELHHAEHLPGIVPFHLIATAPNLGQGTADLEALTEAVAKANVKPGLIVIDTLAQTLGSAEENGAGMIQLIANATALSERFACLVLLVHHSGLTETDRLRGHSSLGCALDALVFFEPKEGALAARLTVQKLKEEADRNVALDLQLLRVVIAKDCDGDEISTLIVDSIRDGEAAEPAPKKTQSQAKVVCDEFVTVYDFLADGKPHLPGLDGRSSVIKVSVKDIRAELQNRGFLDSDENGNIDRVSRVHFSRAKTTLLKRGIFVERGGQIWRKGVANLFGKTDT